MKTSQAGTLESMDCLVTLEEAPGAGVKIEITGASAARFKSAMEKKINEILQQQYDTLKEMEKMYRQMDIGLDIYTIALENYDCVEDEYY